MIERVLLWVERLQRRRRHVEHVTDERYPLSHWRVVRCCSSPFDHERDA